MMMRGHLVPAVVLVLGGAVLAPAQDAAERANAGSMQRKLAAIIGRAEQPSATTPLRTSFSDSEVNAYFRIHGREFLPEGVVDPRITILQGGRVNARAIVDLDQALKPQERSWLDPLAWLSGKVEVTGAGMLRAANGKGVFTLDTATLNGVTVPKTLLQELVTYYSRTPEQPDGFRLDQPFDLPSRIRSVETTQGRATVLQ